jgi:hypothetical protein
VTPPAAIACSPEWTFESKCTSTLRERSKHRSMGASMMVVSSIRIIPAQFSADMPASCKSKQNQVRIRSYSTNEALS